MADSSVGHLKVEAAKGESQINGHTSEIKINAWGFGGSATSTVASSGGSGAPGRPTVSPLWVTSDMDAGAGDLLKFLVEGDHKSTATLSVQRIGTKEKKLVEIKLQEAYVTSWGVVHENKTDLPQIQVQFTYGTISYEYFKQTETGNTTSTGPVSYSPVKNQLT